MKKIKGLLGSLRLSHLTVAGILILLSLAAALLWHNNKNSNQSAGTVPALVYFDGEYRIADGDWRPITEGEHISATRGDVRLRINFHLSKPDGSPMNFTGSAPIAFFTDHIGLTFYSGGKIVRVADNENPDIGVSACGESWTMHTVKIGGDEPLEILVHNPHVFGNEMAIDEMLDSFAIFGNMDFEKEILNAARFERNAGMLLMLVALVFLGIALFCTLIKIKNNKIIWLLGFVVFFAGLYITFSADGVSFFNESVVANTTLLVASMMLYMLFISMIITGILKGSRRIGNITLFALSVCDAIIMLLPLISEVYFFDTLIFWIAVQAAASASLTICLVRELPSVRGRERLIFIGALLPLVAFVTDFLASYLGVWCGGLVSKCVFTVLFAVAVIMVLRLIPHNINEAARAKELELEKRTLNAELAESRISTMMSQIRPHFIYNTLGSIEQLCKLDPQKAQELVHNFAKYLRGNFGELDNPRPILMSQEMEHVHHYVSIENLRFPDMTFTFEMNTEDFRIPALTIQPIVENAIKHGLMKLPKGGTVRVVSYATDSDFCISIVDDGVGFDTGAHSEDRHHVGIRNIRERLKVMVNGTLEIESAVGEGTRVLIKIPKERRE